MPRKDVVEVVLVDVNENGCVMDEMIDIEQSAHLPAEILRLDGLLPSRYESVLAFTVSEGYQNETSAILPAASSTGGNSITLCSLMGEIAAIHTTLPAVMRECNVNFAFQMAASA